MADVMTDFNIRRGLSTVLFSEPGVINPDLLIEEGCWYLCTDTAELYLGVRKADGLTLKRINEKAGWDVDIEGTEIDAAVIIALRDEVKTIKESLNDYAKTSDIPSLEGYATEQYVTEAIANNNTLAKKAEVDEVKQTITATVLPKVEKVDEIIPVVEELKTTAATQEWVQEQNFATETFVTEKISEIEIHKAPTKVSDLENDLGYITNIPEEYITESELEAKGFVTDISGKADSEHRHTISDIEDYEAPNLDDYAKKSELPDTSDFITMQDVEDKGYLTAVPKGFATETYVHEMIAKAELDDKEVDLDAYYTKEQVDELIPDISGFIKEIPDEYVTSGELEAKGYLTSHQNISHLATKEEIGNFITEEEVDAKGFLTKQDISGKADKGHTHSAAEILDYVAPDLSIYYTKAEVDLRIPDTSKFITEVPAEYITENELVAKGYITDVSNKADKDHKHDEYLTEHIDISGKADIDHKHTEYAITDHKHSEYLTEHQDISGKANKDHEHTEYAKTEHTHDGYAKADHSHTEYAGKTHSHTEYAAAEHKHSEYLTAHQDISGKADVDHKHTEYSTIDHKHTEYLTEHQDLSGKANIDHKHTEYAAAEHTHAGYLTEHQDISHLATKESIPTKVSQLTNDSKYLTAVPDEYITETELSAKGYLTEHQSLAGYATKIYVQTEVANGKQDLSGYALKADIPDVRGFIKEIPSEYITEEELNSKGYLTKHQSLEGYAKLTDLPDVSKFIREIPSEYITESELTDKGYLTEQSLDGYAKTTDIPADYLTEADLVDVATKTWINAQGFILNVDDKADVNHTHSDYLTSSDLAGYSKFSGSYNDLTDKPEIPSLAGYALKSEVSLKANEIPFTTTKIVGNPIGSFSTGDSVAGMTIAEILAKLLGLTDGPGENPDVPAETESVVDSIIDNEYPMYSITNNGSLNAESFEIMEFSKDIAAKAPEKSGFYQIIENGEVIQSGYQDLTVENPNVIYIIALPTDVDFNSMVTVQTYDTLGDGKWVDYTDLTLSNDYNTISGLCSALNVDISHIDLTKYTLWADLTSGQGPSGKAYRFIIKE